MADLASYHKSCQSQGVEMETPFQNSQFNWINDINGGNYSSAGLCLVQWDLSSIYNSQMLMDFKCAYYAATMSIGYRYCV